MRHVLTLCLLTLCAVCFGAVDPAQISPTAADRIQGFVDPVTGKVERLEIFDANSITDSSGATFKTPPRLTVILRSDMPALFTALDNLMGQTAARDAALRAKRAAEAAAHGP